MAESQQELSKASFASQYQREIGQPGFMLSSTYVKREAEKELQVPNRWCTFDRMVTEPCVSEALTVNQTLIFNSLYKGEFEPAKSNSRASKEAADYLNHQLRNMSGMTWADACQQFVTHVKDGFSLNEIVVEKETRGKYANMAKLIKLGMRLPSSVYAWVWDEKITQVEKVIQNPLKISKSLVSKNQKGSYLGNITSTHQFVSNVMSDLSYPVIDMMKMVHMRYNPNGTDPQGNSPLITCYRAVKHKHIFQEYRLIGVTRFGGIPVLTAPSEMFEKANDPGKYPNDALAVAAIQEKLANLHNGTDTYIMLNSDVYPGTNIAQYGIKFLGVEGGSDQFDITEILNNVNSEIYSAFNASYLNLGKNGNTTSYNASDVGASVNSLVLEREIINCAAQIEELGKKLIRASLPPGVDIDYKDMPVFRYADPDQVSLEEGSKFLQRLGSINKLTPEIMEAVCKRMGLPHDGVYDLDFTDKGTTKSGTGMGTSGQGSKAQNNSELNLENKSFNVFQDKFGDFRHVESEELLIPEESHDNS